MIGIKLVPSIVSRSISSIVAVTILVTPTYQILETPEPLMAHGHESGVEANSQENKAPMA
jgi:hypothetical protein